MHVSRRLSVHWWGSECFDSLSAFGPGGRKSNNKSAGAPHNNTHTQLLTVDSTLLILSNSSGTHALDIWDKPGHFSRALPAKSSTVLWPLMPHIFWDLSVFVVVVVCLWRVKPPVFYLLKYSWLETIKLNNPGLYIIEEDIEEKRLLLHHMLFWTQTVHPDWYLALTQCTSWFPALKWLGISWIFPQLLLAAACPPLVKFRFNHNRCSWQKKQKYNWRSFLHQSWWISTKPHLETT